MAEFQWLKSAMTILYTDWQRRSQRQAREFDVMTSRVERGESKTCRGMQVGHVFQIGQLAPVMSEIFV
jgi:hypothetical protein